MLLHNYWMPYQLKMWYVSVSTAPKWTKSLFDISLWPTHISSHLVSCHEAHVQLDWCEVLGLTADSHTTVWP